MFVPIVSVSVYCSFDVECSSIMSATFCLLISIKGVLLSFWGKADISAKYFSDFAPFTHVYKMMIKAIINAFAVLLYQNDNFVNYFVLVW